MEQKLKTFPVQPPRGFLLGIWDLGCSEGIVALGLGLEEEWKDFGEEGG